MPNAPYSNRYAQIGTLYKHRLQSYTNIVYKVIETSFTLFKL